MTATEPWTCPNCSAAVSTPFCPACGERGLQPRDLTLRGLFEQLVQAFTNIDGRLIRSFRFLVTRPGFLTVAYLQGRRKPFVGPVSLFLIANVLFFAVESLSGGTIFTVPLNAHLHYQPWSPLAQRLVSHRLEALQMSLDRYAPVFDRAIALNARSLIMLMALAFAPLALILFRRSNRPFVAHAVFALHLYAFLLLLFCVATTVPAVDLFLRGTGPSDTLDAVISIAMLVVCAVYLYVAVGMVYGARGVVRVLKVVALTVAVAAIVLGYRFALLLITLYTH